MLLKLLSLIGFVICGNSNGWNDAINWLGMNDALAAAKQNGKPTMLVIHKRFDLRRSSTEKAIASYNYG